MINIDKSKWPIVYIETDGLATLESMEEYNTLMEELLDFAEEQPDKFGMIHLNDMSDEDYKSHKREKAAQKLSNDWLKVNKPRITENCFGIAMVTKATVMKMMSPIARRSMKRMMGAPGDVFFEVIDAEAWMEEALKQ